MPALQGLAKERSRLLLRQKSPLQRKKYFRSHNHPARASHRTEFRLATFSQLSSLPPLTVQRILLAYFAFISPMEANVPIPAIPALTRSTHQEVYAYAS